VVQVQQLLLDVHGSSGVIEGMPVGGGGGKAAQDYVKMVRGGGGMRTRV